MNDKITCMTVTEFKECRLPLIKMSVDQFLKQSYPNKELLIINRGGQYDIPLQNNIRIIDTSGIETLGESRNIALDNISDGWVIVWDDDDWRHEEYLSALIQRVGVDRTALYKHRHRLNVNFYTGQTYIGQNYTIGLFDINHLKHRYDHINKHEDYHFTNLFNHILLDIPENYYVRFWHGDNVSAKARILENTPTTKYTDQIQSIILSVKNSNSQQSIWF